MQSTMEKTLAAKNRLAEVNRILEKNNYSESRLIPILQEVQEVYKYLSKEIISYVATAIGVPPSRVYGVATFYAHFALTPKGKYVFRLKIHMGCGSLKIHAGSAMGLTTSTLIPRASMILKNRPTPGSTYPFSILEI